jgi:hypothetical protein
LTRVGIGLVGSCLLAVGALGGAVAASLISDDAPPGVTGSGDLVVAVSRAEIDDAHPALLTVSLTERDPLRVNAAGTTTATACRPGKALRSGTALGAIDGRPIRLLSTAVPLWRDLRRDDDGDDVSALQRELGRLGRPVKVSGRVDGATRAAVRQWLTNGNAALWSRYAGGDGGMVLPLSAVVWSAQRTVTPTTCELRLGAVVSKGDPVLTPAPDVSRIALANPVPPLPGRSRVLAVGAVKVNVDKNGAVTDRADVAALTGTPEFVAWLSAEGKDRRLEGTLSLDASVVVGVVPPAAVVGAATGEPCVLSPEGGVTAVRVVSSRLGQSLVVPTSTGEGLPARVIVDRTGSRTCASR